LAAIFFCLRLLFWFGTVKTSLDRRFNFVARTLEARNCRKSGCEWTLWRRQGCQISLSTTYQNGTKYTESSQNIPSVYKIYPMAAKYTKWP
jgi:hypothetical protein